ncbi:hypothetical protein [Leifsonia xyli]|uniref:hypothetical protein n=1 Tax=Leifsonia xyli TaxID=1575 RepID=UPI0002F686B2|nr:hypothetical protein [Leifsonia xyli]
MSLQKTAQTLNDRVTTEIDPDATASTSVLHRENTCIGVVTIIVGAAADVAAFDVATGASALAATALAI